MKGAGVREVVVTTALRTPTGRRAGALSSVSSADLLGTVLTALLSRSGVAGGDVGQVVGGCVSQVGAQTMNVTRTAWLSAGLPLTVAATTVDAQCGSAQQATAIAYALVASGVADIAIGCGVESMSQVPMGSSIPREPNAGTPLGPRYRALYEPTSQFEGAERIADKWGITRQDADAFGKLSQDRAGAAWAAGRFDDQIVAVEVAAADDRRAAGAGTDAAARIVSRDEGLRATTLEGLAGLKAVARPDGVHTAGSSSQIADGAAAVLLMTREEAARRELAVLAVIADTCLVGCDPVLMLEGPIPATATLLQRSGLAIGDIDVVEINEAFASVVLAWERELKADLDRVNPNGGAIAIGHPLGATGAMLITKAVHELQRRDGELALVTMCCGGGLGTGMLLRRE
jgi:acetyl-CoA C-acetyltransferase